MASLRLDKVAKNFAGIEVIKDVDLDIPNGEFVVFVGPSGCGKSTLLRIISGLEECSSGQILLNNAGTSMEEPSKRGLATVFLFNAFNSRRSFSSTNLCQILTQSRERIPDVKSYGRTRN